MELEIKYYKVIRIEGEYAVLEDQETTGELFIALALLPAGTDVGSKLRFENFSYDLLDQ